MTAKKTSEIRVGMERDPGKDALRRWKFQDPMARDGAGARKLSFRESGQ